MLTESDIINILKNNATISEEYCNNLENIFIIKDTSIKFKTDNQVIPLLPDLLNINIKLLYNIIGNANREINILNWTLISLNKALYLYEQKKKNESIIFDIAFNYSDVKYIKILSCNLLTSKLFYRYDGDIDINKKEDYEFTSFKDWFENLFIN